jgi:dTDP-4-dehydrorhamnose 3,5-epimerase
VLIDGVEVTPLRMHGDHRGGLVELLTTRDHTIDPIVHVYQVYAAPGSVRAWVYHEHQDDRLAFTAGDFLIVLFDIRPDSPTRDMITTLRVGVAAPTLLRIPRLVIHGVKNCGAAGATFVNLPTNIYLPEAPDKRRLPIDDPRVPYKFD